jgi:hypothetical protein
VRRALFGLSVDDAARFDSFTEPGVGSCIRWTGATDRDGYGRFSLHNQMRQAHRVAYQQRQGRWLPPTVHIAHVCRQPSCVQPWHLIESTPAQTWLRGSVKNEVPAIGPVQQTSALKLRHQELRTQRRREEHTELISKAYKSLNLTQQQYRLEYGQSVFVARLVLWVAE